MCKMENNGKPWRVGLLDTFRSNKEARLWASIMNKIRQCFGCYGFYPSSFICSSVFLEEVSKILGFLPSGIEFEYQEHHGLSLLIVIDNGVPYGSFDVVDESYLEGMRIAPLLFKSRQLANNTINERFDTRVALGECWEELHSSMRRRYFFWARELWILLQRTEGGVSSYMGEETDSDEDSNMEPGGRDFVFERRRTLPTGIICKKIVEYIAQEHWKDLLVELDLSKMKGPFSADEFKQVTKRSQWKSGTEIFIFSDKAKQREWDILGSVNTTMDFMVNVIEAQDSLTVVVGSIFGGIAPQLLSWLKDLDGIKYVER